VSVDEVKKTLRQEMVAELVNTVMDTKESLRREIMTEINAVLMSAGHAKEYLSQSSIDGHSKGEKQGIMNVQDDFRRDAVSSLNIVVSAAGEVSRNDFETDTVGVLYVVD
jgi:hypothetical protein